MPVLSPLLFIVLLAVPVVGQQRSSALQPDAPIECPDCEEWNQPLQPFKVFGNTYYVGVAGLSSLLIASDNGLILIDGGLPQSAPLIDANIRALGFRTEDIRLIVVCHEHYDHVGGVAALQRASGAAVATSEPGARALATGRPLPEDPQSKSGSFPVVKNLKAVSDGEEVRVGSLSITAHHTPGHTPGATSWSWVSCEGNRCLNFVYADSLNPVSDEGFRFTDRPSRVADFRASIDKFEKLPCDVLFAAHPAAVDMATKLDRWKKDPATNPFVDAASCRTYAATARKRLEARVASEKK
jgi:metallo-beta-lactamase class B